MTLDESIARALRGEASDLYAFLSRNSGLPGERANLTLARSFAQAVGHDSRGPALATKMASIDADEAPGGSPLEFIPVCGVLAAGACGARQPGERAAMLQVVHDACDDLRFRVRDAAPEALAQIGAHEGGALLGEVDAFVEGYFHASALLDAIVTHAWLPQIADAAPVVDALVRAFDLLDEAPRAAARWPGYKALVGSIEKSIAPLALRFGEPVFAAAAGFARSRDPHLREMIVRALDDKKLRSRYPTELSRALAALDAAKKPLRDPRNAARPSRKRGGGRRR